MKLHFVHRHTLVRLATTLLLVVTLGTVVGGCLLVPVPVPGGRGGYHHQDRYDHRRW
jgi:formate/nitrite transporter FocA (FNT family)